MEKPIVEYDASKFVYISLGFSAEIWPLNHPNPRGSVSNTTHVRTSKVITHDEKTGEFETQNTIYKPRNNNNVFRNSLKSGPP